MAWGEWLRAELKGLLREAVQKALREPEPKRKGKKELPSPTITVEAVEVEPREAKRSQ